MVAAGAVIFQIPEIKKMALIMSRPSSKLPMQWPNSQMCRSAYGSPRNNDQHVTIARCQIVPSISKAQSLQMIRYDMQDSHSSRLVARWKMSCRNYRADTQPGDSDVRSPKTDRAPNQIDDPLEVSIGRRCYINHQSRDSLMYVIGLPCAVLCLIGWKWSCVRSLGLPQLCKTGA